MKRAIIFPLCLLLLLTGCWGNQNQIEPTEPPATPTAAPTPVPTVEATPAPTASPVTAAIPDALKGRIIGIDPGHQAEPNRVEEPIAPDSEIMRNKASVGTAGISTGIREHEVVLAVGLQLAELLRLSGAQVMMTRDSAEVNISNSLRAQMFNETNVDLALSLHCAGTDDQAARGAFALVSARGMTGAHEESAAAARAILARYIEETGLPTFEQGVFQNREQTILNWCDRPIVWLELGYLSNPEEETLLIDPDFQEKMAFALYLGIVAYFSGQGLGARG
ncbi:MAG: N-acetylmuramoyl-L-alanine amidase [Clostridiales bacterium]|nr:N-acetylmuramoyl-L-alanine amidase [Clostridiales bacterium]